MSRHWCTCIYGQCTTVLFFKGVVGIQNAISIKKDFFLMMVFFFIFIKQIKISFISELECSVKY